MKHKSGQLIGRGGLFVDEDEVATGKIVDEASGRIHGEGGAANNESVRSSQFGARFAQNALAQGLFVQYDVWFDDSSTRRTPGNPRGLEDLL